MLIKELQLRYKLKTRQSIYDRANHCGITFSKNDSGKSYATDSQIDILDQLNDWISSGNAMKNFIPTELELEEVNIPSYQEAIVTTSSSDNNQDFAKALFVLTSFLQSSDPSLLSQSLRKNTVDNLLKLDDLVNRGILLTSSQVKELIGVKPSKSPYNRGSFVFVKVGKIGKQTSWKVLKNVY